MRTCLRLTCWTNGIVGIFGEKKDFEKISVDDQKIKEDYQACKELNFEILICNP